MFRLIVWRNSQKLASYPLGNSVTIGRDTSNTICLKDEKVSRHHARIWREGDTLHIADLGSTNGTFLNGEAIAHGVLQPGDEIRMGNTMLILQRQDEKELPPGVKILPDDAAGRRSSIETVIHGRERKFLDARVVERSMAELRRAREDLAALYRIGQAINSIHNLERLLNKVMEHVFEVIKAERGFLLLLDRESGELVPKVIRRRGRKGISEVAISKTIINQVMKEGKSVLSADAMQDERFKRGESIKLHGIRSAMCVPIRAKERILGVIHVDSRTSSGAFTTDDLQLLTAIGDEAGIAIENIQLYRDLQDLFLSTVKSLVATIEAKDPYTRGHSERVSIYSLATGEELKLESSERDNLQLAALLHDIGKIGIPENILNKEGSLTDRERDQIKRHPISATHILGSISALKDVIPAIKHHHEHYNGEGYPDGLKGDAIPRAARIIAVADAFDALTSDRPYRKRHKDKFALEEIRRNSNSQFDGEIVKAFVQAYKRGGMYVPPSSLS